MRRDFQFFIYIIASKSRVLYVGMTNGLRKRIRQHKDGEIEGFTRKYQVNRLVYFERFQYVKNCIDREKQLKGWKRFRKVALIEKDNPAWEDLAENW